MKVGLETWGARMFRQELMKAVMKFKEENPGVLEARTAARQERERLAREAVLLKTDEATEPVN